MCTRLSARSSATAKKTLGAADTPTNIFIVYIYGTSIYHMFQSPFSFCVLASTTDNKVGDEKKPSTQRTSTGTELTTVPPTFLDNSTL